MSETSAAPGTAAVAERPSPARVRLRGWGQVACARDQPVLDALLEAGVPVAYGCFTGSCGRCAARLLGGAVAGGEGSSWITERDRARGLVLLCQARPLSDIEVEATLVEDGASHVSPSRFAATVVSLEDVARDTLRVRLRLDRPLRHGAGQYLRLEVPGEPALRAYSIATPPTPEGVTEIELHVRRVRGGSATDRYVFASLSVGDTVSLRAPYGRFVFHDDGLPMLLVAGGTGLAPLEAIAHAGLERPSTPAVVLCHGVRTRADLYDVERLHALAEADPRPSYRPVLSEESWEGRTASSPRPWRGTSLGSGASPRTSADRRPWWQQRSSCS